MGRSKRIKKQNGLAGHIIHLKKKLLPAALIIITLLVLFLLALPKLLFKDPACTVLEDRNGQLLSARIAPDGQWRFPYNNNVPYKFEKCILQFEDRNFYLHPGVNPLALIRAAGQNIRAGKIVSGGSTLSMQVIRLSRKNKSRNVFQKIIEIFLAVRMECSYSKKEILAQYASHAPFGSNVVGLDAAAWRYYGVSPPQLSWAAMATLAVLPNSPSLIYPGKNQAVLLKKRNRLLDRLKEKKIIDGNTCQLSKSEPLPGKPFPLPDLAPHLLMRAARDGLKGTRTQTTIDLELQEKLNKIIEYHHRLMVFNEIHNAAAIILEVNSGKVLAYTGNTRAKDKEVHGNMVDCADAPRSTGSILKPLLYCALLNEGMILPGTLLPDVPTQIGGFVPQNSSMSYDGAVPANMALARSLNIPAVKMLQNYGVDKFYTLLKKEGLTTLSEPASHYGLALITGGAEAKLWDMAGIYASMARTLNHYTIYNGKYDKGDFAPPVYINQITREKNKVLTKHSVYDAAAIWFTFEAMVEVVRPEEEKQWQLFESSGRIAWKTGTSNGNRDAWAVGLTPSYVVAVWAGNADGEGRPGLSGIGTAAPLLFDIFKMLPKGKWFSMPYDDMAKTTVCRSSGYRNSLVCDETDTVWIPLAGLRTQACPYHKMIHLDATGKWQVNSNCEPISKMTHKAWFVLPPVMEWYYKTRTPFYHVLPPFRHDCVPDNQGKNMEMIYPRHLSQIYIPVELDGKPGQTVFKAAHRDPAAVIYWHLDNLYLGSTSGFHEMGIRAAEGIHVLTVIDQHGQTEKCVFKIISKDHK